MIDIATCDVGRKDFPEALHYYDQAFELEPSWKKGGNLAREYGNTLARAGQEAKARELFNEVLTNPDTRALTLRSLAYLDLYHGHYRVAKEGLQEAVLSNESKGIPLSAARDHCILSIVYEGLGDTRSQIRELDGAMRFYPSIADKVTSGLWLVRGYARAGQVDKAAAVLDTMKKQADMNNPSQASLVNFSEAEVDRQRGDNAHATQLLLMADQKHRSAYVLDGLARAYEASGETEQATRWLKAFQE